MKTVKLLVLVLLVLAAAMPAAAQPAKMYDKDVKALIEDSKKTFERFWDALDGKTKDAVFKGPAGEFVVKTMAEDYKKSIENAISRFSPSYSASTEVGAFMKDAARFQGFVSQQGASFKGASEWQAHTGVLGKLAAEYGASFPPVQDQPFRWYTDQEVISATAAIEATSKQVATAVEDALKKDKTTPEPARKALVGEIKGLGEAAKALGSAVKDGKPASALATNLFEQTKKAQDALGSNPTASKFQAQLGPVASQNATIRSAFHVK
jgi:hypothetical protein